jgi:hypothetical protein
MRLVRDFPPSSIDCDDPTGLSRVAFALRMCAPYRLSESTGFSSRLELPAEVPGEGCEWTQSRTSLSGCSQSSGEASSTRDATRRLNRLIDCGDARHPAKIERRLRLRATRDVSVPSRRRRDNVALHLARASGGGRGIRPPGTLPGTVVFKTTAIDHSAIPPRRKTPRICVSLEI